MKYIVIDIKKGDWFTKEFETKEEALAEAENGWDCLTDREKKQREAFYVLESQNPDEKAEDHFDGDIIKEYK